MPELLILCEDVKVCIALDAVAGLRGYHARVAHEARTACEWLKHKSFDLAFISASAPFSVQHEIATLLWLTSPHAPLFLFDTGSRATSQLKNEFVLAGAQVVRGSDAGLLLTQCLDSLSQRQTIVGKDLPIMIIDDLESPREILCFYLESLGYPVCRGYSSAKEALCVLESERPRHTCVITDMQMPEINGKEFIRYVRAQPALCHLPIIVLTAYGTASCLVDCLKAGATGFLVKPPKKHDIVREINKASRVLELNADPALVRGSDTEQVEELLAKQGLVV